MRIGLLYTVTTSHPLQHIPTSTTNSSITTNQRSPPPTRQHYLTTTPALPTCRRHPSPTMPSLAPMTSWWYHSTLSSTHTTVAPLPCHLWQAASSSTHMRWSSTWSSQHWRSGRGRASDQSLAQPPIPRWSPSATQAGNGRSSCQRSNSRQGEGVGEHPNAPSKSRRKTRTRWTENKVGISLPKRINVRIPIISHSTPLTPLTLTYLGLCFSITTCHGTINSCQWQ